MSPAIDRSDILLLRNPTGEPLTGFARDFLRESIKTTMRFPRTQAVIQIAIAIEILTTHADGRLNQISDLVSDLSKTESSIINIKAIGNFIHGHYQKLGFSFPKIDDAKYNSQFTFQIYNALEKIFQFGTFYLKSPESEKMLAADPVIKSDAALPDKVAQLLQHLQQIEPSFCIFFADILKRALRDICDNSEIPHLREFLIKGIRDKPRERWGLDVMFPYVSRVTKLADSAVSKAFKDTDSNLIIQSPHIFHLKNLPPLPVKD